MNHYLSTDQARMQAGAGGTVDIYRRIHKALRACIGDTLIRVGQVDTADAQQVAAVLAHVRTMANFCAGHLEHENRFVHPAIEARFPGASRPTVREHEHHASACRKLLALTAVAEQAKPNECEALIGQLYRDLALFMADNLVHMNAEETENNMILWATHSDAELLAIEQAIVGSLSAEEKAISMRWMIPALNPRERTVVMRGVQRTVPLHIFEGMLEGLRPLLETSDWNKLMASLATSERLAA